MVATATAFTARSIGDALRRFVLPRNKSYRELVVSGGGTHNPALLAMLANELSQMGLSCACQTSSVCHRLRRKRRRSLCLLMRRGIAGRRMCRRRPGHDRRRSWERFRMRKVRFRHSAANAHTNASWSRWGVSTGTIVLLSGIVLLLACLLSCSGKPDANTLVMIIETSPTNLDPRVGIDAYSERIDNLLFDDLL